MLKRDSAIDLYRCVLMFGICLLHCAHKFGIRVWADSLLMPSVCGFAVISGWFGVRFKLSKVLRLYAVQFWCCMAVMAVGFALGRGSFSMSGLKDYMFSFWFVHAYVLMMLLAPLIDNAILTNRMALVPFFIAVFVWGWGINFPVPNRLVPKTAGLDQFGGLALLGSYAAARLVKSMGVQDSLTTKQCLLGLVAVSVIVSLLHLGSYNSPLAFLEALLLFLLFQKAHVGCGKTARLWTFIAPSVFPVYFLHMSGYGFSGMIGIARSLSPHLPAFLSCMVGALAVYLACIVADMPRRAVVYLFRRPLRVVCDAIDTRYESACARMLNIMDGKSVV